MISGNFFKKIIFVSFLYFPFASFAGNKWNIVVRNQTPYSYYLFVIGHNCWYYDKGEAPWIIHSNSNLSLTTEESYRFPNCIIGTHHLTLEGYLSEISHPSVHKIELKNQIDYSLIPHATPIKNISWTNYSHNPERLWRVFDETISCDSSPDKGNMFVTFIINKNGDVSITEDSCEKVEFY